jgi:glycine cleavage system H protein
MNSDPYGDGWIIRMKLDAPEAITTMMSAADYKAELGE